MSYFPLVKFPTTVVWVDDNESFLEGVVSAFNNTFCVTKLFNSPLEALQYFNQPLALIGQLSFLEADITHDDYGKLGQLPIKTNFDKLAKLHLDEKRFDEVAVVIIDYNMPEMQGVELCRRLKHLPFKKILLTGEVNQEQAIEAFNEGVIDRFIRKGSKTFKQEIETHVKELQRQYFCEETWPLLRSIEAGPLSPLSDQKLIDLFQNWCQKNEIREYYVIDKNGTLLTIDDKGTIQYFVIHTNRSLDEIMEVDINDEAIYEIVSPLIKRNKIPFFGPGNETWFIDIEYWPRYYYTPQIFEGRETYWWTVVSSDMLPLKMGKLYLVK